MINGITVIFKEAGFTSHDVVAKMRGICGQKKIGHTGTLDPMATGVLPVCLGSATKLCDMLADRDKEYVAELLLGVETDTQDTTGQVLAEHPVEVTEVQVREAACSFVGDYDQVPPMYSALKVHGKKLYELARAGKEVERKARPVVIKELEILECAVPVIRFRVVCSKGTYIRTLCADIGEKLGCGGTMRKLERIRVGSFLLKDARTLDDMQRMKEEGRLQEAVLPVDSVFAEYPVLHVHSDFCRLVDNGNAFLMEQTLEKESYAPGRWVRVYRPDESFVGIYAWEAEQKRYKPVKMFLEKE
ncbi:MAG TPA: tRNA pseudouridine(55) synthase TruB [Lachnospiraceae bacterium]|nr:tRNA pseudouridine(55) synthase TruB [Lachnospiraceae bacterium]